MKTQAFYNWGRWVALCPHPRCTDAVALYPQSPYPPYALSPDPVFEQRCARGHEMTIEAPDETTRARIETALAERELDADRSWYPKGHPAALMYHQPDGQSIAELQQETAEVHRVRTAEFADQQEQLRKMLEQLGVTVNDDGSFSGSI